MQIFLSVFITHHEDGTVSNDTFMNGYLVGRDIHFLTLVNELHLPLQEQHYTQTGEVRVYGNTLTVDETDTMFKVKWDE